MSKFSNLLRLLILLRSKKRMKTKELAKALGVSERMVRKYMLDLSEANINIDSIPGPTGGYELRGYDYLLNLDIDKEESVALQMAVKELRKYNTFSLIDPLERLKDKIKVVDESKNRYEDYSNDNFIKPVPFNTEKENKFEIQIQAACISNSKIKMKYQSISSGDTIRVIRPYGIVTRNNQKYLVAFCEKKEKMLTFKLVRVEDIEILNENFKIPEDFSLKEFMKNYLGLFNDETISIKLLIKKPFSKSVSEGIFAEDQTIVKNEDGSILFQGTMSGKLDIIRWILSMNTSVTILEPLELKQEIKEILNKMIETI